MAQRETFAGTAKDHCWSNHWHEKTAGADYNDAQKQLLSLCFCVACETRYACAGIDAENLHSAVLAGVDAAAVSIETSLGEKIADQLAQTIDDLCHQRNGRLGLERQHRGFHVQGLEPAQYARGGPSLYMVAPRSGA